MRRINAIVLAALASGGVASGQFVTLNATMTVDNLFSASVSSSATSQGAVFLSGANWPTTFVGSTMISVPGVYYLHVVGQDQGGPEMFIGEFSLVGSGGWSGTFLSNASTSVVTNTSDWVVSSTGFGVSTVAPADLGPNGTSPWGNFGAISSSARFIWHPSASDFAYFTAAIEVIPAPGSAAAMLVLPLAFRRRR